MSDDAPDRLELDDMLLADTQNTERWKRLLQTPQAHELWQEAIDRRQKIDTLAALTRDHEWLAGAILQCKRASRRLKALTLQTPDARINPPQLTSIMLGESIRSISLNWGETTPIELEVGDTIEFELPTQATLYYWAEGKYEPLDGGAWQLEAAEAPVLIMAIEVTPLSINDAIDKGCHVAMAVLLERK